MIPSCRPSAGALFQRPAIMARQPGLLRLPVLLAASLIGTCQLGGSALAAPQPSPARGGLAPLSGRACRLLVPVSQSELQPLRIRPEQVAEKNARGCLSPADAIYGPDGCPLKLCGKNQGVVPIPPQLQTTGN